MIERMNRLMSDWDLLRAYVDQGSEDAFAELVSRHLDMVYAACRRQARDASLAEEATQAVFVILARKARGLHAGVVLPSWLYRVARYAVMNARKAEARRQYHERRAAQMRAERCKIETEWMRLEPLLDQGVSALGEKDRAAIVLRYFEHRSLKEVGEALETTEAAAQMRVTRALAKLRGFFSRRGIVLPVTALGGVLWSNSVRAAPASLHQSVCSDALSACPAEAASAAGELADEVIRAIAAARAKVAVLICAGTLTAVLVAYYLIAATLMKPPEPKPQPPRTTEAQWVAYGLSRR